MKVLRIYHAGRDESHRHRERALSRAGAEVVLVVPTEWLGTESMGREPFEVVEVSVRRAGDVNRHRLVRGDDVAALVDRFRPDVVDLHEEPFSSVTHQLLAGLAPSQSVVAYTAQNLDKRFPPPFSRWERRALARLDGLYPCSRQAASVAVGKGFRGPVRVLPLGVDPAITVGQQQAPNATLRMLLVGRLVPEKGVLDAIEALADVRRHTDATLTLIGSGPEEGAARALAVDLGVAEALEILPWSDAATLGEHYRTAHVVLAPSRSTRTWVEQFGRMVVEAQTAGAVVVGYASGSLPEVVGRAGVLVPEGDVTSLGAAVTALAREPDRWRALRAQALDAAADYSWDAIASGQLELYAEAAASGSGMRLAHPQRARARSVYGGPARVQGSERPFALPVLRQPHPVNRRLEHLTDRLLPEVVPGPALRVVHLDHTARLSGGEIALERLIAAGSAESSHVILGEDGPLRSRLVAAGATVEVLALPPGVRELGRDAAAGRAGAGAAIGTALYVVRLARRLHRLRPDVVHANSLKSGYYGSLAARLAGVPVVWHVRDRLADDYMSRRSAQLTRILLRRLPHLVLANSRTTAATTGVRARVVADPYQPRQLPVQRLADSTYVVGMVGRISPWKGQHVVLQAVAQVPGVRLRFVGEAMFGEDEYAASLRTLANELGVADRVTWVGFVDDVEAELAELDVLVHASVIPEPFGQVVIEGMAAGLPVVATNAGGPAEVITDGVDGLLCAPNDVAALVAALNHLRSPSERRVIGQAALARAIDFAPDRIAPLMAAVWRDAVGVASHRRRGCRSPRETPSG